MSVASLTLENFQLKTEVRRLRNELATMKGARRFEDSEDVARMKQAYAELEKEVVQLRCKLGGSSHHVESQFQQIPSRSADDAVLAHLADSLEAERVRFAELQAKYSQLRNSVTYSDQSAGDRSTCASPMTYRLSLETVGGVVLKPELEAQFKTRVFRRTIDAACVGKGICGDAENDFLDAKSVPESAPPAAPKRKPSASIGRLSKIARFRNSQRN